MAMLSWKVVMATNLIIALANIAKNPITDLASHYKGSNRANNMGDALEMYIKDVFCDSLLEKNEREKNLIYGNFFSYLGNQNNPPDIILRGGDAIEVKKIKGMRSALALNSSHPKDKLHADDPRILKGCVDCESKPWKQKDIIYAIGVAPKANELASLWFVYGDCYAADREVYKKVVDPISSIITKLTDIELTKTKEIAGVKKVDPLGITYLRVRGMWGIENPIRVFGYLDKIQTGNGFNVNAILLKKKYDSFPASDKKELRKLIGDHLKMFDIKIKSPNNPANWLNAKLITFNN